MQTLTCTKMKAAIESILRSHGLLEDFQKPEFVVRIRNDPFMPLSIERHGSQVTVTHYFVQNGDMIPDPDLELEIIGDEWHPVAIQFATGHYRRAVEYRDGKRLVHQREVRDQARFSSMWARNLIDQGFSSGEAELLS